MILWSVVGCLTGADAPRTGRYTTTFSERSPMSSWAMYVERMGALYNFPKDQAEPSNASYELTQEPYDIYVPKSYDGSVPYGLIAYVNSGLGGGPPGKYAEICDQHKLIWVGGTKIDNDRTPWFRIRLSIDGVHNIRARYHIDNQRIYAMGQSGGGRVASRMAVPFADVFSGGAIYLIGCNPFRAPADKAVATRIDALAKANRFAFVTGSEDYNKPGTIDVHADYRGQKFPHLIYLEQPGLDHNTPSAEWFEKAVVFNDAPVLAGATAALTQGKDLETKKKHREAYAAYQQAASCAIAGDVAMEAASAVSRLVPVLDGEAATELTKLAEKLSGAAVRTFVQKWPAELPTTTKARDLGERLAGEELDKLGAKPTVSALRGFLKTWGGYAVRERAISALDLLAKDAWPKAETVKPGAARWKALAKFVEDWSPTPTADLAAKISADEIATKVSEAEALATDGAKAQRLKLLYGETKGTPANSAVQTALIAVALRLQEAGAKP
ncbi:MAG: hypothetical protein H0W78_06160 [Planctomycetes bacterium]|nr:hypothetical protein [Planctomycetota bacterium]